MKILKTKNYQDMSRKAANIISAQIILNPESDLRQSGFMNSSSTGIAKKM